MALAFLFLCLFLNWALGAADSSETVRFKLQAWAEQYWCVPIERYPKTASHVCPSRKPHQHSVNQSETEPQILFWCISLLEIKQHPPHPPLRRNRAHTALHHPNNQANSSIPVLSYVPVLENRNYKPRWRLSGSVSSLTCWFDPVSMAILLLFGPISCLAFICSSHAAQVLLTELPHLMCWIITQQKCRVVPDQKSRRSDDNEVDWTPQNTNVLGVECTPKMLSF